MDEMATVWTRLPGQSWSGAAVAFFVMWIVMMAAMMLPSLTPTLWRYRAALRESDGMHGDLQTILVGLGYFFVWAVVGLTIYPVGAALASVGITRPALARVAPIAAAIVVLVAGGLQFSNWKARRLDCCRSVGGGSSSPGVAAAWRHGLSVGIDCSYCCAGLMAVLLAFGVTDVRVMISVTTATTVERLAPNAEFAARVIGFIMLGIGLLMIATSVTKLPQ